MEYYISVNHSQHPEVTRVADASDEWDADDLSHSHSFDGYKTTLNDNRYWDFILTENPNQKPLYLVYVLHSSCDSFHREDGCMCKVSLVNKYEDAVKIRTAILKHERDRDKNEWKSVPLKVELSTGKVEEIYCGTWQGYFERFESVEIETLNYNEVYKN